MGHALLVTIIVGFTISVLNSASVFIEILKKQVQAKWLIPSRWICRIYFIFQEICETAGKSEWPAHDCS